MKYYQQNHKYMREKKNFHRYVTETSEQSRKKEIERKLENDEKYGIFRNLIMVGEIDRLSGRAPQELDEERQRSYSYGYYEKGSRTLAGKFDKGVYSSEVQRSFGIMDLVNGVPEKFIKNLKEYPAYLEGRSYQMGRNSYDYTIKEKITIEDYINIMGIIYPEIQNPAFKIGYSERQLEEKQKNKTIAKRHK